MARMSWPEFANRWMWLCPLLAVVLAAGILWTYGLDWWTAMLAATLLVCPALILWGAIQVALDAWRRRARH
jgi:predicted benzoate:H+ symporter BenE